MFACIVRDFSVPILSMFVNAMQDAVDASGFGLQVASSYHDTDREIVMLEKLARRRIDGVVIASSSESDPRAARGDLVVGDAYRAVGSR